MRDYECTRNPLHPYPTSSLSYLIEDSNLPLMVSITHCPCSSHKDTPSRHTVTHYRSEKKYEKPINQRLGLAFGMQPYIICKTFKH